MRHKHLMRRLGPPFIMMRRAKPKMRFGAYEETAVKIIIVIFYLLVHCLRKSF